MTDTPGAPASGTAKSASRPPASPPAVPDLSGIEQAITALTAFLRHGQATPDRTAFTTSQLEVEDDFRALVRTLGRPRDEDLPGRFEWKELVAGRVELTKPLPADVQTVRGFTAQRKELWRVDVATTSSDRRVLIDKAIVRSGVVRLRAYDAKDHRLLVGFPARSATPPSTPVIY